MDFYFFDESGPELKEYTEAEYKRLDIQAKARSFIEYHKKGHVQCYVILLMLSQRFNLTIEQTFSRIWQLTK